MSRLPTFRAVSALVFAALAAGCASSGGGEGAAPLEQTDAYTLVARVNLISGYEAVNSDGSFPLGGKCVPADAPDWAFTAPPAAANATPAKMNETDNPMLKTVLRLTAHPPLSAGILRLDRDGH